MITTDNALHVIGARGLLPSPSLVNTAFELINRLDGLGNVIRFWDSDTLGPLPTDNEWALAESPLITLQIIDTETGINAVAQCANGGYTGLIFWRVVAPDSTVYEAQDNAVNGGDNWEVDMGQAGIYTLATWASDFGYVEQEYTHA